MNKLLVAFLCAGMVTASSARAMDHKYIPERNFINDKPLSTLVMHGAVTFFMVVGWGILMVDRANAPMPDSRALCVMRELGNLITMFLLNPLVTIPLYWRLDRRSMSYFASEKYKKSCDNLKQIRESNCTLNQESFRKELEAKERRISKSEKKVRFHESEQMKKKQL